MPCLNFKFYKTSKSFKNLWSNREEVLYRFNDFFSGGSVSVFDVELQDRFSIDEVAIDLNQFLCVISLFTYRDTFDSLHFSVF